MRQVNLIANCTGEKKPDNKPGFRVCSSKINAWRTEDAYAPSADRLSYAQLHGHHG